nr:MAG TPA: hypothetical protein [Caudoviricetes sp.]DAY33117.1 MAG TPA: hypothetical protein [Caudoviricetes sp.]
MCTLFHCTHFDCLSTYLYMLSQCCYMCNPV